jgi:c-di-GMP-binding flagellar brake protein YcgR
MADSFQGEINDSSSSERREHKRVKKAYSVHLRPETEAQTFDWDMVLIQNISAGGLQFRHESEWKIGMHLDLKIHFALNQAPIRCTGQVVRCLAHGNPVLYDVGVRFVSIGTQEATLIDDSAQKFISASS